MSVQLVICQVCRKHVPYVTTHTVIMEGRGFVDICDTCLQRIEDDENRGFGPEDEEDTDE